ncbi:MAG: TonB-dependent receptor, partial [Pseudomonadota bacterium]
RYFGKYQVEGGVRLERVKHKPTENESRNFNLQAVSLGVIRPMGDHWTVSAQIDHSSRAPVAEELYSNGPHLATSSFEIGDSQLDKEVAFNIAASVEYVNEGFSFMLSAYRTDFDDFIFELATGEERDELPVLQWQQQDADFQGFEADVNWQALRWDGGSLAFNAGFDTVRARLSGTEDDDLPRIPPQRWRVGSVLTWNNFVAEINFTQVDSQDDVSPNELPTRGYDNLRAYLGYRAGLGDSTIEFFVRGENLTDDEQRYHTSFIKDLAPQPGRTIEGGVTIRI